jgi:hypothetical protein
MSSNYTWTFTAADVSSGLTLHWDTRPTATLTVTAINSTPGEAASSTPHTIVVTDPPAIATGAATISGTATLELAAPSAEAVSFAPGSTGILKLDDASCLVPAFSGAD